MIQKKSILGRSNLKRFPKYNPIGFEEKWRSIWFNEGIYSFKIDSKKNTYYNLVELPYPSGDLHLGHWFSFVTADVHARTKRMQGENIFFPNGFDAFGLPAENAAIKRGIHPKDWTILNIKNMKIQFNTMGTMIDWNHEVITCLPEYYKWNQWIFLKMFKNGLAYRGKVLSNWCPKDQTVLANENIENGKCWRCGTQIEQKEIEQWFLKLTAYADKLLWPEEPSVDWPQSVREAQNNWIGRKEGINITYKIEGINETVIVFTTRPDTNFGATFLAIAPEHRIVSQILNGKIKVKKDLLNEIIEYIDKAKHKTELDRIAEGREKTGVFTGLYAVNSLNNYKMPIWVSDFVLSGFGTGALIGVPGHDLRDFEFAKKFNIEIKRVVIGKDGDTSAIKNPEQVQEKEGRMINSGFLNGLDIHKAIVKIIEFMVKNGYGKKVISYHIHDWSISRQRYWGTPIPIIHCNNCGIIPVAEKDLPIELPYDVDFSPTGKPPLATAEKWINISCPKCGGFAKRDSETMDTFFDSSWYYYRYTNPHYNYGPFDPKLIDMMMPVNIYYGGQEHTLGHTLYARFFTKFFHDIGLINFVEFAKRRVQHGVILGTDGYRMSKSRGNVVNPDDIVKEYGTDTVRTYLCFMMPYESTAPWSKDAIWGVYKFLNRIWDLQKKLSTTKIDLNHKDLFMMNQTIRKVGDDINLTKFNTGVAQLMKWINYLESKDFLSIEEYITMLKLVAPFAPHLSEEIWQTENVQKYLNRSVKDRFVSIHQQPWPKFDKNYLSQNEIEIVIQINGKLRDTLLFSSKDIDYQEKIEKNAKKSEKIKKYLTDKKIIKVIYVKGKIINFVI